MHKTYKNLPRVLCIGNIFEKEVDITSNLPHNFDGEINVNNVWTNRKMA